MFILVFNCLFLERLLKYVRRKMRRNKRILVVFVLIWISVIVYLMYRDDTSEVLVVSECTDHMTSRKYPLINDS